MSSTDDLIATLQEDYQPDYWSDVARTRVGRQLAELDDQAYTRLHQAWRELSEAGRVRLAEALFLDDKPRATELLIALLSAPEPAVGSAVAEILLEKNYVWSPEVSLLADLKRHLQAASPAQSAPIERLMRRLPA